MQILPQPGTSAGKTTVQILSKGKLQVWRKMCVTPHHRRTTRQRSHVRTTHSHSRPSSRCRSRGSRGFPAPTNDRGTRTASLGTHLPSRTQSTSSSPDHTTTTAEWVCCTVVFPAYIADCRGGVSTITAFRDE